MLKAKLGALVGLSAPPVVLWPSLAAVVPPTPLTCAQGSVVLVSTLTRPSICCSLTRYHVRRGQDLAPFDVNRPELFLYLAHGTAQFFSLHGQRCPSQSL